MIKAVVFDLDNTLIPWLDEFDNITKNVCKIIIYLQMQKHLLYFYQR